MVSPCAASPRNSDPRYPDVPSNVRHILDRVLIDLSWNSSRLEGNTYSLLDTKRLIELGDEADNHDVRETQMIVNHKSAIEFLVEAAPEIGFDRPTILNLHAILADNLLPDPTAPGRLRTRPVGHRGIGPSAAPCSRARRGVP